MEKMEAIPQNFMSEPVFKRLEIVARYAALDKEQQAAYKASLKIYRDNNAIMQTERAEGRAEERLRSMRILKEFGVPVEKIAEQYHMSVTDINRLLDSL